MSKWATLSVSSRTTLGAAILVLLAAIGAGFWIGDRAGDVPSDLQQNADQANSVPKTKQAEDEVGSVVASEVTDEPSAQDEENVAEAESTEREPAAVQTAPSIDEVRMESDGLAVIAGRAAPGSLVSVIVDGKENVEVTADSNGKFAAVSVISTKSVAQELTIVQNDGSGEIESLEQVILAPTSSSLSQDENTVASSGSDSRQNETTEVASLANPEKTATSESDAVTAEADGGQQDGVSDGDQRYPSAGSQPAALADTASTEVEQKVQSATDQPEPAAEPAELLASVDQDPAAPAESPMLKTAPSVEDDANDTEATSGSQVEEVSDGSEQQVTVLKSTADGVEVLGNTSPQALENIEIDSISYSDTGDVRLAGRAQSDTELVRVYVDNRRVVDLQVGEDGEWRGDLPEIDTGVYTLRVDEVASGGEVTSRVETPFKREDPAVLANIDNPASVAKQITVQTGNTLWAIARDRYGEGRLYVQVFEANRESIRDPDLIYPGQVFALPDQ